MVFIAEYIMREAMAHPQWRQLLELDDDNYGELCVDFFRTFTISKTMSAFGNRLRTMKFHLGGECRTLTFNGVARAMELDTHLDSEWEGMP
ncbi:unnamed protein product [Linum trigynum]|uniref:Uncharacterized protein n=1 Tax=Linum trigynum TaxID=586398 RepID=A0AAV2ESQ3_9ROSI